MAHRRNRPPFRSTQNLKFASSEADAPDSRTGRVFLQEPVNDTMAPPALPYFRLARPLPQFIRSVHARVAQNHRWTASSLSWVSLNSWNLLLPLMPVGFCQYNAAMAVRAFRIERVLGACLRASSYSRRAVCGVAFGRPAARRMPVQFQRSS